MRGSPKILALLSLLLCVVTLAAWALSFLPPDLHAGAADGRLILLFSDASLTRTWQRQGGGNGGALADVNAVEQWNRVRAGMHIHPERLVYKAGAVTPASGNSPPAITTFAGFAHATEPPIGVMQYRLVAIPLLYPAVLLAIPPILWLAASFRQRRRTHAGRCAGCGYDLRASPGRCPECGADGSAAVPA